MENHAQVPISSEVASSDKVNLQIVNFLRSLADDFENDQLDIHQQKLVSDFYMKYQFEQSSSLQSESADKSSPQDMMRFLSLGWYIYTQLIPKTRSKSPSDNGDPQESDGETDGDPEDFDFPRATPDIGEEVIDETLPSNQTLQ